MNESSSAVAAPSPTASPAMAHAILAAAVLLPGMSCVHAQSQPDRSMLSFKYLDYQESQADMARVGVRSPLLALLMPIAGEWSLAASITADTVSGASPRYHTSKSGASQMHDARKAGDIAVTRYVSHASLTVGAAFSTEHDYDSRALSLTAAQSSDDNNTTWSAGLGGASDAINPVNHIVVDASRQTVNALLGLTRVVGVDDLVQLTYTRSHAHGYLSDPYKTLDRRPPERDQHTLLGRWHHHLPAHDASMRLSYRYYRDSFGIRAHTLAGEYAQQAGAWTVTPALRLYSQQAARFYVDPVYHRILGAPFPADYVLGQVRDLSTDQRLSAFGAVTAGIKLARSLGPDWSVDIKVETYRQASSWRLLGHGSPGLAPLRARSVQLGLTRLW